MKKLKLAALVGAFAVAFSAIAETTSWFDGKIEAGWPNVTGMNGAWSANATDLATFQEARLELDSGDSVLDFTATSAKDLAAGTKAVTYSTKVQFYPFSSVPEALDPDAKAGVIVVYDQDYLDNAFYVVQKDSANSNAWAPLLNNGEPVLVNTSLAYELQVKIEAKEANVLSVTYTINGQVYSPVDVYSTSTSTGKACYSGSGYVESLTATSDAVIKTFTIDTAAVAAAHLAVVSVSGATGEGPYTVNYGDTVTITFAALDGYVISGATTATYAYADISETISTFGEVKVDDIAQIGEVKYQRFADAVAAVQDGETITLLKASSTLEDDNLLIEANNVVLDLGGFELTLPNVKAFKFGVSAGKTVTVQNGKVTMTAGAYGFHVGTNAVANINCAMEKKSSGNPVIDIYGGTVNCTAATQLTGAYDIFRFKDTNLESTVNISGGTYTMTATSIGLFHHYKAGHIANINVEGGDFTYGAYLIDAAAESGKAEPELAFAKLAVGNAARFSRATLAMPETTNKVIIGGVSKLLEDADLLAANCELVEDPGRTGWYMVAKAAPQGFSVIITFTPATGITGYKVSIDGATASQEYVAGQTFEGITTSLQVYPMVADWYKAQFDGKDGTGLYEAEATVVLTAAEIPPTDIEAEGKTVAQVAEEVGMTTEEVENLAPAGATDAEKKAKLVKAMTWARANGQTVKTVAAFNFAEPGQAEEAYLLGTAVDAGAIKAAKDNFKFESITPGTTPAVSGTKNFNGTVTVQGSNDLETWGDADGKQFFKATLTK